MQTDQPEHLRHVSLSPKSPYVREKTAPEPAAFSYLLVSHRVSILRSLRLRISDMGTTLDILCTDPRSFPAVLLLRTVAIYSGSKRVAIPLSIAYAVCPQDKRLGLCG